MKSPVGSHPELKRVTLDDGISGYQCPETGGLYLTLQDYWQWQKQTADQPGHPEADPADVPVSEFDETVKLCPETGTLMMRYRVGHGLLFRVDRSATGGVWLDAGEWEALHAGGLHRNLHRVFTAPWQKAVRDADQSAKYDQRLEERLGKEFHARLEAIRQEIWAHPSSAEALAYLQRKPRA